MKKTEKPAKTQATETSEPEVAPTHGDTSPASASNNQRLKVAGLALILVLVIVGGIFVVVNNKPGDDAGKKPAKQNAFDSLQAIENAKDCNAGLQSLPAVEQKKPELGKNEQTSLSIATLQYRINCNLQLKKYDESLKTTDQLDKLYQIPETAATEEEKTVLKDKIADIKQAKADNEFQAKMKARAEELKRQLDKDKQK